MVDIEDIPPKLRWEIAAKSASSMPVAYDLFFRKALGERYEEIEMPIWIEAGREVGRLATALWLPADDAAGIVETMTIASKILFGPEFRGEMTEAAGDRAVGRIIGCPVLNRAMEMAMKPNRVLHACEVYVKSAVENLNPKYSQRFEKRMCAGDPF
ncbi:MAG: hypothetical protein WCY97_00855 [Methanothrix sp.]|jgi:hypothetical protein|uniref:Uncharacterized protein n=1 Tax=Methanothrix harundinacea TaxID=301375 RepID=A0A117MCH7_9EURY|nr:MAG: hypothetical protein APR56_00835 [Methanosaeta sp. SDB]KUK45608.1 MAG: hypothetical protein XD72_0082 [Methanothrix harundinacea]MDD2637546.1 hypothetical protein [Methanothrix sp.]MDI9398105.1 hypothetical protein [Euryarchaeota archaeon]KUK96489.1 MAG: hypothetical protein XE07_1056 [Methanothrix harundinacea]